MGDNKTEDPDWQFLRKGERGEDGSVKVKKAELRDPRSQLISSQGRERLRLRKVQLWPPSLCV